MIVAIGSINLDLVATVERLPGPGETVAGGGFATLPGGKGANQAVAAALAGAKVRMIGAIGNDAFADAALPHLLSSGVDIADVRRLASPTGVALILVDTAGENAIAVVPGANGLVTPEYARQCGIARGDIVLLQQEIPLAGVAAALDAAKEAGAISILNTAPFLDDFSGLADKADYLVANETEFDLICAALDIAGEDRKARMLAFAARTGNRVIVTLGAGGAVAAVEGRIVWAAPLKIEPVDTVGAGDTFCGYFAAGLASGSPAEAAMRRAAVAASLACLKPGAQSAMPHAQEVDAAL